MSEVVAGIERELLLYQYPEMISWVEKCHIELLQVLESCHETFSNSSALANEFQRMSLRREMEKSMAQIRKLSEAVLREVNYRHRSEMRDASHRLVEMQMEQRKILISVEDQKRLLESLQEERSIMSLVQEQQKIMQVVQDIQRRMHNSNL